MSMYGCCAIDLVWPPKLQNTWLSGYWPLVWLTIESSSTWVAAGIAAVLPQNCGGGAPLPPVPPLVTVQVKAALLEVPVVSVAVTVTVDVPVVVGVPVI